MPRHRRRRTGPLVVLGVVCVALLSGLAVLIVDRAGHLGASPTHQTTTSSLLGGSSSTTGTTTPATSSTTTTTSPMQAPMPQPSAQRPLTIVEVGDSLGEDLGFGLGDYEFASDPFVHVIQAAKGDTGLARPDFYNWPAALESLLAEYHPGAVIVFLGANDSQSFYQGSQYVAVFSALWHRVYAARVALMMSEALDADARVVWVGMPIMQSPAFSAEMQTMNSIYQAQAALHPGALYFSSWPVFCNSDGQYQASAVIGGQDVLLRDPDGIHIASGGGDLLAQDLVAPMERAWKIRLFPPR